MSIKVMTRVWDESAQKGGTLLLLLALADHAADDGFCWPGQKTLAKKIRMSGRSVARKIQELEDAKELYVIRQNGEHNWYIVRVGMSDEDVIEVLKKRKMDTPDNLSPVTHVSVPHDKATPVPMTELCHPNLHEPSENTPEAPADAGTSASDYDLEKEDAERYYQSIRKDWTSADVQYIEMVDAQDREHACTNCDATFDVYTLLKTDAKCFECKRPVQVTDWNGDKTFRQPLQKYRPGHRQKRKAITVGDVVENCPPHLAPFSAVGQITRLKDALLKDRDTVLECLDWAHGMFRQGKMQPPFIVGNALTAAEKRIALLAVQLPEEAPPPPAPVWVEPEWLK